MPSRRKSPARSVAQSLPDASSRPAQIQLVHLDVDPLATLESDWQVMFADRVWTIPAQPAATWLRACWENDFLAIFPGLCGPEAEQVLDQALWEREDGLAELQETVKELATVASGRQWWVAFNLTWAMRGAWDKLGGHMILAGVDPYKVTWGAWLDAAYALMLENCDPQQANMMITRLTTPPAGIELAEEDMDMDDQEFMAALNTGIPGM